MSARYLIRLDDACSTMHAERWAEMEGMLDALRIRPIVAVVPQNLDLALCAQQADPAFWDKVRAWKAKGWTIAMHGYQHQFHRVDRRCLMLPFYDRSEFAGLAYEEQAEKIRASWRLFDAQGVLPSAWVAPAHCFDRLTLRAVERETPIRLISDGIACDQYFEDGFYWLPQQLWAYVPHRTGLWTICIHPNSMGAAQIDALRAQLAIPASQGQFASADELPLQSRARSLKDKAFAGYFWQRSRIRAAVAGFRGSPSTSGGPA